MSTFQPGDRVFAALDLFNDPMEETGASAIPGINPGDLLAPAGTRGMVVNVGHVEAAPEDEIYLVSFETRPNGSLAEPIGCLADELSYGPGAP
jgi:nitrogen fixation protein NifZ